MSPIDDELRALFSSRADVLTPAPDPFPSIERRAKRMRRNRMAASVAGTALAVGVIAAVVPTLVPETVSKNRDGIVATQPPREVPSPAPSSALGPAALDPQNPWEYRGDPALVADNELASLRQEWQARNHPGSDVTPLFGSVSGPPASTVIVFIAQAKGVHSWGVATSGDAGWEFPVQSTYRPGATVLMGVLPAGVIPGDEVSRLLVVAAPSTGLISYAANGTSYDDYDGPLPGVAFFPLGADTSTDRIRVLDGNGDLDNPVFEGPAPDRGPSDDGGGTRSPDNVVSWPTRGATVDPAVWEQALTAYARGVGAQRNDVEGKVLFAGDDDSGNRYVFGQAWISGNDAHTFGYTVTTKGEAIPFLGPIIEKGPAVLAFALPGNRVVVVPEPAVRKTYYGQPQSEWIEIVGQEELDGVTIIDRAPGAAGDLIKLETATGRLVFRGELQPLLCGIKGCG